MSYEDKYQQKGTNINRSSHVNFRAHTKNAAISTDKSAVSGSSHDHSATAVLRSAPQTGTWVFVQRECLCSRLRLDVATTHYVAKEKNPWVLGKMFENRFPDASGREEG
jgi:hypothetical protein